MLRERGGEGENLLCLPANAAIQGAGKPNDNLLHSILLS